MAKLTALLTLNTAGFQSALKHAKSETNGLKNSMSGMSSGASLQLPQLPHDLSLVERRDPVDPFQVARNLLRALLAAARREDFPDHFTRHLIDIDTGTFRRIGRTMWSPNDRGQRQFRAGDCGGEGRDRSTARRRRTILTGRARQGFRPSTTRAGSKGTAGRRSIRSTGFTSASPG